MARLTGRFGTLQIGGTRVADLFDWTLEYTVEALPCPIKGEKANTVSVGGIDTRITASRFWDDQSTGNATSLSKLAVDQMANDPPGAIVTYVLQQIDGVADNAKVSGTGVVVRGGLNAPRGLSNDTFEIVGIDVPTIADSAVLV